MTRSCKMAEQSNMRQHNTAFVSECDASLTAKCLDICQTLATKGLAFSFSLKIGSSYTFSLESRKMDVPKQRKKASPSTQRRNALRRQKFLESKEAENFSKSHSDETEVAVASSAATENFNCDACDFIGESNISLRIHKNRMHKTIPQLDGVDSESTSNNVDDTSDDDMECKFDTDFYWERRDFRRLWVYQLYSNVLEDINEFAVDDQEKAIEKEKATQRRKDLYGEHYTGFPPWKV